MKNYNYSIHNDLISNFLFLASCVGNYEMGDLEVPQYSIREKSHEIKKGKDVYPDLEKIYNILKMKFNSSESLFENNEKLLLSRFFNWNWRLYIRQELYKGIKKGNDLSTLKNGIISSLNELEYRLGLKFTWDLSSSIENKWHQTRNREFYSRNDEDKNLLESIGVFDQIDDAEEDVFPLQINGIQNDIDWVKDLNKDDIEFVFMELHPNASENELTKTIMRLLKQKRYFNKHYKEEYSVEIKKLNNYLFSFEKNEIDFNLSFIEKEKQLEFVKIYFYCKKGGFITSTKTTIISLFADVFNRGKRSFHDITDLMISEGLNGNNGVASYVNDLLLLNSAKKI